MSVMERPTDGKSCTIDLTVTNGINPGSNVTNQSPSSVRMPPPGPNSSWINSATLIWPGFSNDYTALALATLYAWNDAGYDLSAAETWLRARYVARGGNLPVTSSDNQQWLFGAGWSS